MHYSYEGQCQCGNTRLKIKLPNALSEYQPRRCDCTFCLANTISYLSDPAGSAVITYAHPLRSQQQGSNQADFLTCNRCTFVLAAVLPLAGEAKCPSMIGAINTNALAKKALLQDAAIVSPKLLSSDDKKARWRTIWMPIELQQAG